MSGKDYATHIRDESGNLSEPSLELTVSLKSDFKTIFLPENNFHGCFCQVLHSLKGGIPCQ